VGNLFKAVSIFGAAFLIFIEEKFETIHATLGFQPDGKNTFVQIAP
jgi:hypothetical protein